MSGIGGFLAKLHGWGRMASSCLAWAKQPLTPRSTAISVTALSPEAVLLYHPAFSKLLADARRGRVPKPIAHAKTFSQTTRLQLIARIGSQPVRAVFMRASGMTRQRHCLTLSTGKRKRAGN